MGADVADGAQRAALARAQALQLSSGVRLYKALGGPWSELGTARE